MHRFFAPALDPGDELVALPRDEAEHLLRVLRLGVGDTVAVFDGRGHEFLARVTQAARRDVQLQLLSRVDAAPESPVHITLVQAVLKGEKMDDVVRDAVMLGVHAIQPLVSRRSETSIGALLRGARPERWRRVALVALCGSVLWLVPILALTVTWGWEHTLSQMAWFFTKAALLTFGGAYAVLPYVYQGGVEQYHWLSATQMIDGLALGETTPGPLILVLQYVGFFAGWNNPGVHSPLLAAATA